MVRGLAADLQGFERSSCGLAGTEEQRCGRAEYLAREEQSHGAARRSQSGCRYGLRKLIRFCHKGLRRRQEAQQIRSSGYGVAEQGRNMLRPYFAAGALWFFGRSAGTLAAVFSGFSFGTGF